MCGLGKTAPKPTLATIRYFREEYETHIREKKCPAGVCKELIQYFIHPENCTGCRLCVKSCPVEAISGEVKKPHRIDTSKCIKCDACHEVCKFNAVLIK